MEVIIELQGQEQNESFQTVLKDNTTLLNIAEMIQEAQYYKIFNLSEQFCLEIKGTNKFISSRQTLLKGCLEQQQIDTKAILFHRGLDGQKKMSNGVIIDQNLQIQPNSIQNNQKNAQNHEDTMISLKNNQQVGGVVIGGNGSESQNIKIIEQNMYLQNQPNNFDTRNMLGTQQSNQNQLLQQNQMEQQKINQYGQYQTSQIGKQQQQFNQQSIQNVNQINQQNNNIQPQNQQQQINVQNANQVGQQIGGDLTQSEYYRQLGQNNLSQIKPEQQQSNESTNARQSTQNKIRTIEISQQNQQLPQSLENNNSQDNSLFNRTQGNINTTNTKLESQQLQQSQQNNNQQDNLLFTRTQTQIHQQDNGNSIQNVSLQHQLLQSNIQNNEIKETQYTIQITLNSLPKMKELTDYLKSKDIKFNYYEN